MTWNGKKMILISGILGIFILGVLGYYSYSDKKTFSAAILSATWHDFRKSYVEASTGRTVSNDAADTTTSEDQAMTLLRAVWQNDQQTFNTAWTWMRTYLKHKDDSLFATKYGKRPDGSYGIFPEDQGSSSGADTDTALALLFAYARWGQPIYQQTAHQIMNDIWNYNILIINNRPYLLAGSLEKTKKGSAVLVSPSEYSFYAFRIFAGLDDLHDWNGVLNTSYDILYKSTFEPLDKKKSANIPPDWLLIDRTTGRVVTTAMPTGTSTNFSTKALRIPWRLLLDWQWYQDERTKTGLTNMQLLGEEWRERHALGSVYSHDGKRLNDDQSPAMYGGTLGYFLLTDPQAVMRIRDEKILEYYDEKENAFYADIRSFDATWMWLGLALSENILENLLPAASVNELHNQFIRERGILMPSSSP
jgi:endo-1,4-beta-D-glucanase Y